MIIRNQCPNCLRAHARGRGYLCQECDDAAARLNRSLDIGAVVYFILAALFLYIFVRE
jgi:hypothetical protein